MKLPNMLFGNDVNKGNSTLSLRPPNARGSVWTEWNGFLVGMNLRLKTNENFFNAPMIFHLIGFEDTGKIDRVATPV